MNGCSSSSVSGIVTVNPNPLITVSPPSSTIISGTSIGLTTSGANSYSWSPSTYLSCTTCPNPIASPLTTTTYTIIGVDVNGCSDTTSTTITVTPPPCGSCPNVLASNGILSVSPAPYQVFCVNNNITINGNVTISKCELRISPNVTITVSAGSTLNILGSHLYACTDMWQGIVVQPLGRLNINLSNGIPSTIKSTLIEDAIVAVDIVSLNQLTTNVLTVNSATFNRNLIGIRVLEYKLLLASYPFTIVNSVFTCRNIPFVNNSISWPLTSTIKATNPTLSPLETPYINNTTYSQTGTNAFLKAPYAWIKSQKGIYLENIGEMANATSPNPTYYEMVIGTTGAQNYNVFDNHAIGIDALNANIKVVNSIFQNTITSGNQGAIGGIGIQAIGTFAKRNRLQVVAANPSGNFANKFFDCSKAIRSQEYFDNIITNNDFTSMQVYSSTALNVNKRGKYGVYITSNIFRKIDVSQNTLTNIENGIVFYANNTGTSGGLGQVSGQVDINYNKIRKSFPGFPMSDNYVSNAIMLGNVIYAPNFVIIPGTTVNVSFNTINKVFRGISTTNWQRKILNTTDNTISLVEDGAASNPLQYGISHTNNIGANTPNNTSYNTITGFNTTELKVYGIYSSLTSRHNLTCNTTTNTYHGIAFAGNCALTQTRFNTMSNHHYGFVLDNNGVIGTQGSITAPCDNQYFGTWPSNTFKTATINGSSAQNSKMYVHNNSYSNPNGYGFSNTPLITNTMYSSSNGSLLTVSGNQTYVDCSQIFGISQATPNEIVLLEKIVQNQINEVISPLETQKINKHHLYRLLKTNPEILLQSTRHQNFYTINQPMGNEKIVSIESDYSTGDLILGSGKVANLTPQDNIETNYKLFYEIYNSSFYDTITPIDSLNLITLANGCPFTDGAIVYQARALYNTLFNTTIIFEDNCPENMGGKSLIHTDQNSIYETEQNNFELLLYPNPTTGKVFVSSQGIKEGNLKVMVMNITGKEVYNSLLLVEGDTSDFYLNVESGTYIVTITNTDTYEKVIRKITIQK